MLHSMQSDRIPCATSSSSSSLTMAYFTPESFYAYLPSLLISVAARTSALRLSPVNTSTTRSGVGERTSGALEIQAEFFGPSTHFPVPPSTVPIGMARDDENNTLTVAHTVLRVRGDADNLNGRWCSALQRQFSIISLLLSPDHTDTADDEDMEKRDVGGVDGQPIKNARATRMPTSAVRPCWSLRYFSVDLAPLLPRLAWDRDVDGVFGSLHSVVQRSVLTFVEDTSEADAATAAWDGEDERRHPHRHASVSAVYAVRVAAILNAAVPAPHARLVRALCETEGAASCATAACVVLHTSETALWTAQTAPGQLPSPSASASVPTVSMLPSQPTFEQLKDVTSRLLMPHVRVDEALAATLVGVHKGRRRVGHEYDDVCRLASLGTSYLLAWAHAEPPATASRRVPRVEDEEKATATATSTAAERACTAGITTASSSSSQGRRRRRGHGGRHVVTATEMELAQTSDAAVSSRTSGQSDPHPVPIPTSPHPTIQNVVFILDVPMAAWSTLLALDRACTKGSAASCAALDAAMAQLAALMECALGRLAHSNTDVCFFHHHGAQPATATTTTTTMISSTAARGASATYTRQLLTQSIAESITSILFSSTNGVFVEEAERLLFSTTHTPNATRGQASVLDSEHRAAVDAADTHGEAALSSQRSEEAMDGAGAAAATAQALESPVCESSLTAAVAPVKHRYTAKQVREAIEAALR